MRQQAQGQFLMITIVAVNLHKETSTLASWDFVLKSADGISYKISSAGSTALLSDEPKPLWLTEEVQPSLIKPFQLIFDVSPSMKTFTLEAAKVAFRIDL